MHSCEIQEKIENLTVWRKGDQRAPHKPLLVLYALGRLLRGKSRLVSFVEADQVLLKLLKYFGPPRKSYHPEYPFWRLQHDGLWELTNINDIQPRRSNTDAKKSELVKHHVQGGFPMEIFETLSNNQELILEIVYRLLDTHFPETFHEDILHEIGIQYGRTDFRKPVRDPLFREKVLRAYEYQCAICGFNIRLGETSVALEAAHIKWHAASGPDTEDNGLAMCSLHHKLFDRGAFTVEPDLVMLVSEKANGTIGFNEWLMDFHGKPIKRPQRERYLPQSKFTLWHIREVFQEPSRYV